MLGFLFKNTLEIHIDALNSREGDATTRSMILQKNWKFGKVDNFKKSITFSKISKFKETGLSQENESHE